ncbi:MAG: 3-methyl-2-oxobutanoate dehydrogenase subunit VorB [Candidatus Gastranaerophilales bacterium]|nr:3-methyl-2-oxobutanoate dehydrogenase subunit VorB [Candidatus Gastranaerophilales bacterium]
MAKTLISGNKAIAQAAFDAGCDCYFSYPITPQTAIGEYLSEIMPKANRGYVCAESEIASINMVIGAASTGEKAMTSSSSCAISLMQEGLSYAVGDQLPLVLISVMRAGPGLGYIYPSQCDYDQAVTGGGNGDYRIPVLAPSTVQECVDLTHRAFYLSQKYRNPVIVLSDGLLGQMMEPAEFVKYPYPEIDTSKWALTGAKGRAPRKIRSLEINEEKHNQNLQHIFDKYAQMEREEVLFEEHNVEDAEVLLVAFGTMGRNIKAAMNLARQKGLKVGTFRPITLFPFPNKRLSEIADKTKKIIVAEMNMGQMIKDVKVAVNGKADVVHIGRPAGAWLDETEILEAVEKELGGKYAASI